MITEIDLDESVDTLNHLLRGEFAAIESYEYALSRSTARWKKRL